jgi:hypothetical protein
MVFEPFGIASKTARPAAFHVGQVGLQVVRDGGWNGDQNHIAMRYGFGRGGGDVPAFSAWCWNNVVHVRIACRVLAGQHHVNGALRNIHAPDLEASIVEADGCRQAHIAQADDADRLYILILHIQWALVSIHQTIVFTIYSELIS